MGLLRHGFSSTRPGHNEREVRAKLAKADINGDGSLNKEELKKVFKEMGSNWPGVRTWHCMKNSDSDGDGKISSSEKEQLVAYIMNWYDA